MQRVPLLGPFSILSHCTSVASPTHSLATVGLTDVCGAGNQFVLRVMWGEVGFQEGSGTEAPRGLVFLLSGSLPVSSPKREAGLASQDF